MIRRSVTQLLAGAALVAASAGALAAQGNDPLAGMRVMDVDRVVAVVGRRAVFFSEVVEQINIARSRGLQVPRDSAGQMELAREFLNQMIDQELLIAVARDYNLTVPEQDVAPTVDAQIQDIRGRFRDEAEFRTALAREGYGTPEEYRRRSIEEATRQRLQALAVDTLKALGRLAPVNVTEREVSEAFERLRGQLGPRPATVSFRQLVVSAVPSAASKTRARTLADSLRVAIDSGASFDSVARAYSADGSAPQGGDLGWQRRGVMVKPFEDMMFALIPGRISPVVETDFGYHVIRVDRVRPGEVRVRHILIMPAVDSNDVAAARVRADSALALWKGGMPYDTLISRFHTPGEERTIPDGVPVDSLPVEYRLALRPLATGQFSEVFSIPEPARDYNKWIIAQVILARPAGEFSLEEYQERVRQQLKEEKSTRRTLDALRREYYVSIRM